MTEEAAVEAPASTDGPAVERAPVERADSAENTDTADSTEPPESFESSLSGGRRVRARLARLATPRTSTSTSPFSSP